MRRLLVVILCLAFPSLAAAQGPKGYYRFPTIHGNTIVFAAEGDLWTVGTDGGTARRITTHLGEEALPAISPDGKTLAFTATYEGPPEVYTMPLDGGVPTRRTYNGASDLVVGWTPDGKLLYATSSYSTLPDAQLVELDPANGTRKLLSLAQAADGAYDRAGGTLYFTRLRTQGSHTKRYKGGTAQNVWKLAPGAGEATNLTADFAGTSRTPMWWNGRVYFVSDRDGTMNLWSMNPDGGDLRQHTHHVGWDVKDPSLSDGKIVYQLGADLHLYDIGGDSDRALDITLTSDFDQMREHWIEKPTDYLTAAHLSPDGDRLVLTARGEVFVAPVDQGRFVRVTRAPNVRYRSAHFMPGGKSLIVLSDESGEVEWWELPADGIGDRRQISDDGRALRFDGVVSPDGKWVASFNHDQELWLHEIASGKGRKVDFSAQWGFNGLAWSPDSRWLVYAKPADNTFSRIHLYNVQDGTNRTITTDRYDSYGAQFSPDGKWLYLLSDRHYESLVRAPWGPRQPEPFFDKTTQLFAIALQPGLRFPFQPADELHPATDGAVGTGGKSGAGKADDKEGTESKGPAPVKVDFDGIEGRLYELPVMPGNYGDLSVTADRLFWLSGERGERGADLMVLKIGNHDVKPETLVEGVRDYELTADGKKVLVRKRDDFYVIDASSHAPAKPEAESKVDLSGWTFPVDPKEEWRQIFVDSWRLERDYFWSKTMNGVDWQKMLQKYLPLVDRVTNRGELSDLMGQMAGELSALHTFVYGGDQREGEEHIEPASLGAELVRDDAAGGYRVQRIYRADPDHPDGLSPLARPGVDVHEGDVITMINGVATTSQPPGALLRNQAGKQVRLRVRAGGKGDARDVIVEPVTARQASNLRYGDWEYSRRQLVDSLSDGKIGYVHLRAMGSSNVTEWYEQFYPVFDRQGLIVDVRHNRGGNIDSWILEKLLRRAWFYWQPRVGDPYWNMQYAFRGHAVALIDQWTASDGEAFAEGFKRLGLGKLIGMRTWGGEIWLTSSNVLVDRGIMTASEFGVYGPEGQWLVEGHGVDPDMMVDNPPHGTFEGDDAQLTAAVNELLKEIRENPNPVPPHPAYPDKSSADNGKKGG